MEKAIDLMAPILGTAQATELTQEVMKLDKVNNAGARIGALISADPA
jgi:hypothetical protein